MYTIAYGTVAQVHLFTVATTTAEKTVGLYRKRTFVICLAQMASLTQSCMPID